MSRCLHKESTINRDGKECAKCGLAWRMCLREKRERREPRTMKICKCGSTRMLIKPAWYNDFKKARWVCAAKFCPFKR